MNIHNVSLTVSAVRQDQYPKTGMQEFAFVGRSNVGKSSLINKLLNRKSLARVSQTPGKTVTINFYNVDDTIFLVDLPGYGYAARAKTETEKWGKMMEDYLAKRDTLEQIFLLVDSRHPPTADDLMMLDWIRHYREGQSVIVIATKTDKLKKREFEKNLEMIWKKLELGEDDILVPFSNQDEEGKFTVWDIINLIRIGEYDKLTEDGAL
ncbi:MAG: YihA family ribosome biogenesis GTP-binding protein [Ruminococcaceae bacterium]|nr:YihA family ribosome biogenesis GTP-binding protein [Oscillospiraceae bacterium]